jgi:hypothetical protein
MTWRPPRFGLVCGGDDYSSSVFTLRSRKRTTRR